MVTMQIIRLVIIYVHQAVQELTDFEIIQQKVVYLYAQPVIAHMEIQQVINAYIHVQMAHLLKSMQIEDAFHNVLQRLGVTKLHGYV